MAVRDLIWTQDGDFAAQEDRMALAAIFGARLFTDLAPSSGPLLSAGGGHGVVGAGDFAVSENGTPNMSVNVAAGVAVIRGTDQGDQGVYIFANDAAVNVAISAADATNPRIDLIILQATDTEYGAGASAAVITKTTGTPGAVPAAPTPPENSLVLASVSVPALDTAIGSAQITNISTRAYALGGTAVARSSAYYPTAVEGQRVYDLALHQELVYDGSGWTSGGGGLLAVFSTTAGSQVTAPTAFTDVDATNAAITFVMPPSGEVLVRLTATVYCTSGTFGELYWALREGSTTLASDQMVVGHQANLAQSLFVRPSAAIVVTGTPGATRTLKWAHKAATGTYQTMLTGAGPAVMEVTAIP